MDRIVTTDWTGAGRPRWAADYRDRDHLVPGGARLDASAFSRDAIEVTLTGAAAAGATTLNVEALSRPMGAGALLHFGEAGEFARLTEDAPEGAVALTVEAIPSALEAGDTARYEFFENEYGVVSRGKRFVPSGTAVVSDDGSSYRRAGAGDANAAVFLTAFDVEDADADPDAVLYRPGSVVKENLLPGFSDLHADVRAAIRRRYVCIQGVS